MIQQAMAGVLAASGGVADFHTKAVNLDGSTENMANSSLSTIGIANSHSVFQWINSDIADGTERTSLDISPGSNANRIVIGISGNPSKFRFIIGASGGSLIKLWSTSANATTGIHHIGYTWNGTTFKIYVDGVDVSATATKSVDTSGTMTDTARKVFIGSTTTGGERFNGQQSKTDIWNSELSASEITELYDSGNGFKKDTRNDFGNYTSSANIKHQWALGKDDTDASAIGTDYVSSGNINVGTNASNISSADVVTFT